MDRPAYENFFYPWNEIVRMYETISERFHGPTRMALNDPKYHVSVYRVGSDLIRIDIKLTKSEDENARAETSSNENKNMPDM